MNSTLTLYYPSITIEILLLSDNAHTMNFHRDNIIGVGGYGNVYKGFLSNELVVAVKRFKNCTLAGDASFVHEMQVISNIRHHNLVALNGFCMALVSLEGHQRIIVYEYMPSGSLHDHLFGHWSHTRLNWGARCKIADDITV